MKLLRLKPTLIVILCLALFIRIDGFAAAEPDYPMPPFSLAYSPDGTKIVGSADRLLRVWSANTEETLVDFPSMNTTYVLDVTWSPDSKRIASASADQYVRVWNVSDLTYTPGQLLRTIQPITGELGLLSSVDWSPNGQLLAIGSTGEAYSLRIWDANTYAQVSQFKAGWVERIAWYPNIASNKLLVSDDNGGTTYISGIPSNYSSTHIGRNDTVGAMAWNSDGSQLALGYNDGTIYVWDTATNTSVSNMDTGVQGWIYELAWSADDQRLASTNGDGMVQVWNASTGEPLGSLSGVSLGVDFSPNSNFIVYAGGPEAIQIVPAPELSVPTPDTIATSPATNTP